MLHVLVLKFIKLVKYNINSNNEEAVGVVVGKEKFSALLADLRDVLLSCNKQ